MEKSIKNYVLFVESYIKKIETTPKGKECNIESFLSYHLTKLSFFQHERLIHLLVTIAFAFLTFFSIILFATLGNLLFLPLSILLLVLLVPYIRHYYILENNVQKMYDQYDRLQKMLP